jgi:hypothetical protein
LWQKTCATVGIGEEDGGFCPAVRAKAGRSPAAAGSEVEVVFRQLVSRLSNEDETVGFGKDVERENKMKAG